MKRAGESRDQRQRTLLAQWRAGEESAGAALMRSLAPLVWHLARRYGKRCSGEFGDEMELTLDLMGEGMAAVWRRLGDFDEAHGSRVSTFMGWVARCAMLHYLRDKARMICIPGCWQDKRMLGTAEEDWPRAVATDDEFPEMADDGGIEELLDRLAEKPRVAQAVGS